MNQHGAIELRNKGDSSTFLVNGQRVKHYIGKNVDCEVEKITLDGSCCDVKIGALREATYDLL